jgi:AraC-like DNA-binding protein
LYFFQYQYNLYPLVHKLIAMHHSHEACFLLVSADDLTKKHIPVSQKEFSFHSYASFFVSYEKLLKRKEILGIVFNICPDNFNDVSMLVMLCKQLRSDIPLIGLIKDIDFEIVRKCGSIGVDKVIDFSNLNELTTCIDEAIRHKSIHVQATDFNINPDYYTGIVAKALRLIEQNYVRLMGTAEIARVMCVTESTLCRLFKKSGLVGPKKILMYFKIRHATNLLSISNKMSLKKISALAGFSNEKRFIECFFRVLSSTPSEFRKRMSAGSPLNKNMWNLALTDGKDDNQNMQTIAIANKPV